MSVSARNRMLLSIFAIASLSVFQGVLLAADRTIEFPEVLAGAAKVDITDYELGPVHGPLHARALCIKKEETTVIILSLDVVAIGEIGYVPNDFLGNLRARLHREFDISPDSVIVNASHCHGKPVADIEERAFQAVQLAVKNLRPVRVGVGVGVENRISENRRLKLKDGSEVDVRHAYALPPDSDVVAVGPIDPQIGVVKFETLDGQTLAVVYNFACHPIQGVPGARNTADISGFASQTIEDNLGPEVVSLFVQGCGGDINPVYYKDVDHPRDAELLGNQLALSTLQAIRSISCRPQAELRIIRENIVLPRADFTERIYALELERDRLVSALHGTSLNLKTFVPLVIKYQLSDQYPAYYAHHYMHESEQKQDQLRALDAENRQNLKLYVQNILTMEKLTRVQTNLALLRKHQQQYVESGNRNIEVEVLGLRLGESCWITFPGELTVPIGLKLKAESPNRLTFIAGYTNGYIYYCPTAEQLRNIGNAQEDSDCILAPSWQPIFERQALQMLEQLN